jgi:hypothetical protein
MPFSDGKNTAFQSVIFSRPVPSLLSYRPFSWTQGLKHSTGNEGKVLRGDQDEEMKNREIAAQN